MEYEMCGDRLVLGMVVDAYDRIAWASRTTPWPHQASPSPPQRRAIEVEEPLSGAAARAAINLRYQPPPTERAKK